MSLKQLQEELAAIQSNPHALADPGAAIAEKQTAIINALVGEVRAIRDLLDTPAKAQSDDPAAG